MINYKTAASAMLLALMFGLLPATTAQASIVKGMEIPNINTWQDTDVERVKSTANLFGEVELGTVLEAIIRVDTVNGINPTLGAGFGGVGPDYELTGHSLIKVVGVGTVYDAAGAAIGSGNADLGKAGAVFADYTFGSGFADGITTVKFYEEKPITPATNFNQLVAADGVGGGIDRATDGTSILSLGFKGADDFWTSSLSPINPSGGFPDLLITGSPFHLGQSVLTAATDLSYIPDGMKTVLGPTGLTTTHDFIGNGNVFAPTVNSNADWDAETNTTFRYMVPEPTTLLVWSLLGLTGCTILRRRHIRSA